MNPFAICLSRLIAPRGAAAELARNSGVHHSQISRFAVGPLLPEVETFTELARALGEQDRDDLTVAYLLAHQPTPKRVKTNVHVIIGGKDGSPQDRLAAACSRLDARSREDLATIVEKLNLAPDLGLSWLHSMAGLLTSPDNFDLQDKDKSENLGDLPSSPWTPPEEPDTPSASAATSTATGQTNPPPPDTAKPAQLPTQHWHSSSKTSAPEKAAETTTSPKVPRTRQEVTYPRPKRPRKTGNG